MKITEIYSYTGCASSGGPWEDVVADGVQPSDLLSVVRRWCADVEARAMRRHGPGDRDRWRFDRDPEGYSLPQGFAASVQLPDVELNAFHGQGELYRLVAHL